MGVQQKKPQKKSQVKHKLDNFKHGKSYLLEIGMIQGGLDIAYIRALWCQFLAF